jgi:HTH-type transcriptional regulator / antitoxin HigA
MRVEEMNGVVASPEYTALLKKFPPKVIHTEEENEAYTEVLYELDQRKSLSNAEKELAELLTLLIEDFGDRKYRQPRAKPLEAPQFLMEQRGLRQKGSSGHIRNTKNCLGRSQRESSWWMITK